MTSSQPSKNSRCPCGSGKRYWQCCRTQRRLSDLIEKARHNFIERTKRERAFAERYGHARSPMAIRAFGNKTMVAIGGSIYLQTRKDERLRRTREQAARRGQARVPDRSWRCLVRFAYDLYTIRDNAKLETALKKRLLNSATFQSARHELWVAALCVAAGFQLEFEDETEFGTRLPTRLKRGSQLWPLRPVSLS